MFGRRRHQPYPIAADDTRYCVLCETYMMFELIAPEDSTSQGNEWICTTCGSAVFVDPYVQYADHDEASA